MNRYILFFGILFFATTACQKKDHLKSKNLWVETDSFKILLPEDFKNVESQGIDSYVGEITNKEINFIYEDGYYTNDSPSPLEVKGRNSFDGYYYTSFFNAVHIDEKLHKIFRDSVKLIGVVEPNQSFNYIVDCSTCNQVLELLFKKNTYFLPINLNPTQIKRASEFTFHQLKILNTEVAYLYTPKNKSEGTAGIYIKRSKDEFGYKALAISCQQWNESNSNLIEKALQSVQLKTNIVR